MTPVTDVNGDHMIITMVIMMTTKVNWPGGKIVGWMVTEVIR